MEVKWSIEDGEGHKTGQISREKVMGILGQVDDLSTESSAVCKIGQMRSNFLRNGTILTTSYWAIL
mgnify:CR=1 FL=1